MILWFIDRFGLPGHYHRIWVKLLKDNRINPSEVLVVSLHNTMKRTLLTKLGSRKAPTWIPEEEYNICRAIDEAIAKVKPNAVVLAAPESLACLGLAPEHATLQNLRGSVYWRLGVPHIAMLPMSAWNALVSQKEIGAANYGFESQDTFAAGRQGSIPAEENAAGLARRAPAGATPSGVRDAAAVHPDSIGPQNPARSPSQPRVLPGTGPFARLLSKPSQGDHHQDTGSGSDSLDRLRSLSGERESAGSGIGRRLHDEVVPDTDGRSSDDGWDASTQEALDRSGVSGDPTSFADEGGTERSALHDADSGAGRNDRVFGTDGRSAAGRSTTDSSELDDEDGEDETQDDEPSDGDVDQFFYEPVLSPVGRFVLTADTQKLFRILRDGKNAGGPSVPIQIHWR